VGGAIASDVHGKNHHVAGSFCDHVLEIELITPEGVLVCSRSVNQELFWATCGGMGLTGLIFRARIQMIPVTSSMMKVNTERFTNLDDLMNAMIKVDKEFSYSVAWVDSMAKGKSVGRSVLSAGEHFEVEIDQHKSRDLKYNPRQFLEYPKLINLNLINQSTVKLFNELWYRKSPTQKFNELQTISKFFHPLDGIKNWNRVYGESGFIQYQFIVPDENSGFIKYVLKTLSDLQVPIFLSVLKRFGKENKGVLSFPKTGWTLAIDIPTYFPGLPRLLDHFDRELLLAKGRVYLTKDSRLKPEVFEEMYPSIEGFREIKRSIDPNNYIQSDLSLRLRI
jgi:decaprenylphospho-beta-D-ribofuranose 2-oxidase